MVHMEIKKISLAISQNQFVQVMDKIVRIQKLKLSKISSNFSNQKKKKKTGSNVKLELRLQFIIPILREIEYLNKYCTENKLHIKAAINFSF